MKIKLSLMQWEQLKKLVAQGGNAQRRLSLPINLSNGVGSIEIETDGVKIELED